MATEPPPLKTSLRMYIHVHVCSNRHIQCTYVYKTIIFNKRLDLLNNGDEPTTPHPPVRRHVHVGGYAFWHGLDK